MKSTFPFLWSQKYGNDLNFVGLHVYSEHLQICKRKFLAILVKSIKCHSTTKEKSLVAPIKRSPKQEMKCIYIYIYIRIYKYKYIYIHVCINGEITNAPKPQKFKYQYPEEAKKFQN